MHCFAGHLQLVIVYFNEIFCKKCATHHFYAFVSNCIMVGFIYLGPCISFTKKDLTYTLVKISEL